MTREFFLIRDLSSARIFFDLGVKSLLPKSKNTKLALRSQLTCRARDSDRRLPKMLTPLGHWPQPKSNDLSFDLWDGIYRSRGQRVHGPRYLLSK